MKKPVQLGISLLLFTMIAACGDSTPPGTDTAAPAGPSASALPAPDDALAALAPEARPYGLDVYTAKCASCHGDLGQGIGKVPALKGLTRAAIQQKLHDYRSGKTFGAQTAVMAQAVRALSDAGIAAASIYAGE